MKIYNVPEREVIYCKDLDRLDEFKDMANEIVELGLEPQISFGYYEGMYIDIILNTIEIELIYLDNINYSIKNDIKKIKDLNMYILNGIDETKIEKEFIDILKNAKNNCLIEQSVYVEEGYCLNNILSELKDKYYEINNICKKYNFTKRAFKSWTWSLLGCEQKKGE